MVECTKTRKWHVGLVGWHLVVLNASPDLVPKWSKNAFREMRRVLFDRYRIQASQMAIVSPKRCTIWENTHFLCLWYPPRTKRWPKKPKIRVSKKLKNCHFKDLGDLKYLSVQFSRYNHLIKYQLWPFYVFMVPPGPKNDQKSQKFVFQKISKWSF